MELRGDWVLVRPVIEEKTHGGLYLSDRMKEGPMVADVVAVGPGRRREEHYIPADAAQRLAAGEDVKVQTRIVRLPMDVKVGDRIIMPRWAGYEIKAGDETLLLLREEKCLAVIKRDEEE